MVYYLPFFLPHSQFLKLKAPQQPELSISMDFLCFSADLQLPCGSVSCFYPDNRHINISKHASKKVTVKNILFI